MHLKIAGIYLAKDIITVGTMDSHGKAVDRHDLRFAILAEWLVQLPTGCA